MKVQDPEKLNKLHTELLAQWDTRVSTWADFFGEIDKKMKEFQKCGCQTHAMDVIYSMYAFLVVMRDNPEEGDIKTLMTQMVNIMVFDSEQKLGASFHAMSEEDMNRGTNAGALLNSIMGGSLVNALLGEQSSAQAVLDARHEELEDGEKAPVEGNVLPFNPEKKLH